MAASKASLLTELADKLAEVVELSEELYALAEPGPELDNVTELQQHVAEAKSSLAACSACSP